MCPEWAVLWVNNEKKEKQDGRLKLETNHALRLGSAANYHFFCFYNCNKSSKGQSKSSYKIHTNMSYFDKGVVIYENDNN